MNFFENRHSRTVFVTVKVLAGIRIVVVLVAVNIFPFISYYTYLFYC